MFMCLVVFEIIIYLWIAIYIPFIFVQQTTFKHFAALPFHTFQYDEKNYFIIFLSVKMKALYISLLEIVYF